MALTELGSAAEVLVATGHDPFARGTLRRPIAQGWLRGAAVAWLGIDPRDGNSYLHALGTPVTVGALITELVPELPRVQRATLPRGSAAHLPAWVGHAGVDWDFRWLDTPLPVRAQDPDVGAVEDDPAVAALLAAGNPDASVRPGDPQARRWWGVRDRDGSLTACAADTSAATAVGHLSAVTVRPDRRGRGLGRAVTVALTNDLLGQGCDVVTLGMYSANTAARALYDALGFADTHHFTSGPLTVRGQW